MPFHHSAEIVSILPRALDLSRSKHKFSRVAVLEVLGEKHFELVAHINRSIFLILQSITFLRHVLRVDQSMVQIEPRDLRRPNFLSAKARMEPTVQDELQFFRSLLRLLDRGGFCVRAAFRLYGSQDFCHFGFSQPILFGLGFSSGRS
jgi:hypothetical protein